MPPKNEGVSLTAPETSLLVNIIRHKTGNITGMTDWDQVASSCGYKNAANAKTMFSRLCKNKLEKMSDNGTEAPAGGIEKSAMTQGKKKDGPKKDSKKAKATEEAIKDEDDDGDDDEGEEFKA